MQKRLSIQVSEANRVPSDNERELVGPPGLEPGTKGL